ncbi:MAG: NAD-dependent epimerase/dehydratase family protein [Candidatus Heimdallarchaeaceae archaeon]
MIKVLVTGASGCIGQGVLEYLSKNTDYELFGLVRRPIENLIKGVTYLICDLTDYESLDVLIKKTGITDIYHFAAAVNNEHKDLYEKVNVQGTINLIETAKRNQVKRFFFSSSAAVYGIFKECPITEDSPLNPIGYYAKSKVKAEKYVQQLCEEAGIKGAIIRIPLVLGKGSRHFYVFARKLIKRNLFPIMGKRNHKIGTIHAYDVARAILTITEHSNNKIEVYNVSSYDAEFEELIKKIELIAFNKQRFKFMLPYPLLLFGAMIFEFMSRIIKPHREPLFNREYAQMIGKCWTLSNEKIMKIGYKPMMSLEDMIKDSERDYINNNKEKRKK